MMFLGVDGGGTKTAALLVDSDGQVIGSGTADGSNYHSVGMEAAFPNVRLAVEAALHGRTPDAACFAMAGADLPHDFRALQARLNTLNLGSPYILKNDVIGALRAGSRFPYGVAVVCGTGFNAGGIGKNGREFRLPAMGPLPWSGMATKRSWPPASSTSRLRMRAFIATNRPSRDPQSRSMARLVVSEVVNGPGVRSNGTALGSVMGRGSGNEDRI